MQLIVRRGLGQAEAADDLALGDTDLVVVLIEEYLKGRGERYGLPECGPLLSVLTFGLGGLRWSM